MYQLGNHCCMWETAILTKCWYLNTVVWLAGKSFAHLTSKAKLTQNIRKSPVVEEVRNLKSAPSVGLWAVASFDVRYLQSSVSTSLSICHLGVMFPDSKREQMPRRLPRLLSIILTTEEEKIDCALSPNSEDGRRGRRYLRLKAQSRALIPIHWPQTKMLIRVSRRFRRCMKNVSVWDWKATLNVNTSVYFKIVAVSW